VTTPYGYPSPQRRPTGATAILAGLVGLGLAGVLGYLPATMFIEFGISDLPGRWPIVLGIYLGAALLLLIGALVTFFRALAGAILLLIGGLVAVAAVLLEPVLLYPAYFAEFFKAMFQLTPDYAFVRVSGAIGGPLVILLASLPWTFRFLRYRPVEQSYGPVPGYPPRAW
jgi:hypothetical protein